MRDEPSGLPKERMAGALRRHFDLDIAQLAYLPVGAGSYHWRAVAADGTRYFVTADDLTRLNTTAGIPELCAAYATSRALYEAGLSFVVAPLREVAVEGDWAIALLPYVEGRSGDFGVWDDEATRREAAHLVGRLHAAAPPDGIQRFDFAIPSRAVLERALQETDRTWTTGPYGEAVRKLLDASRPRVEAMLAEADALAAEVASPVDTWVVTHGEPHSGNFIRASDGTLRLVDWDTVRLAPRERDLATSLEGDDGSALAAYREAASDYTPHETALRYFALHWTVADICVYVRQFRSPHEATEDAAQGFADLCRYLQG